LAILRALELLGPAAKAAKLQQIGLPEKGLTEGVKRLYFAPLSREHLLAHRDRDAI